MWDTIVLKIVALMGLASLVNVTKQTVTRWIIKTKFTRSELPLGTWYSYDFLMNLGLSRLMWLGVIASFTAITFPIGMQLSSYKIQDSFPIMRMVSGVVQLCVIPVAFAAAYYTLGEMPINRNTITGLMVLELSYCLTILGGWIMFKGVS